MKQILLLSLIAMFLISCINNSNRYTKIAEAEKVEPKFNEKYGTLKQAIVVILDSKKNDIIYYDVWGEKILTRVKLK